VQGLTLIMACRSVKRAEAARTKLYGYLDAHISLQRKLPGYDGHADTFRGNLKIEIQYLDLSIIQSVFRFGKALSQQCVLIFYACLNSELTTVFIVC
jgi:3-keto steroid reductase